MQGIYGDIFGIPIFRKDTSKMSPTKNRKAAENMFLNSKAVLADVIGAYYLCN